MQLALAELKTYDALSLPLTGGTLTGGLTISTGSTSGSAITVTSGESSFQRLDAVSIATSSPDNMLVENLEVLGNLTLAIIPSAIQTAMNISILGL